MERIINSLISVSMFLNNKRYFHAKNVLVLYSPNFRVCTHAHYSVKFYFLLGQCYTMATKLKLADNIINDASISTGNRLVKCGIREKLCSEIGIWLTKLYER